MSEALVKVEVDIFSGVSNPCQSINFDLLLEKSKCLYVAHEIAPQPPPLGYRGLIIHFPPESGGRTRVFKGYCSNSNGCWHDKDRVFETWLIDIISREMRDPSLKAQAFEAG